MQNVFFNDEILSAEKKIYSSLQISPLILMENAGINSSRYIIRNFKNKINNGVVILTGKGNNSGDGFVIARHLVNENIPVKILMLYTEKEFKGDALINYKILKNLNFDILEIIYCKDDKAILKEILNENKIIVDAIFGVGFNGKPDTRIKNIFDTVNKLTDKIILSIDTPSGLYNYNQNSSCVKTDYTLTMGARKFHSMFYKGKENSGKIEVMNIGVSEKEFTKYNSNKIFLVEEEDVKKYLPVRKTNSNKYSNGKVFILAGSKGLTGAAYLCSESALRSGCGAVITGVPESINDIMENKLTEVMTLPLNETEDSTLSMKCYDEVSERLKWADTILIGPGLSKNDETMELVRNIVKKNDLNYVIDADGIFAFKDNLNLLRKRKIILTPHAGEFSGLIGKSSEEVINNFYELSTDFAKEYGTVLVLKNAPTIITNGKEFYINPTGKENLATAGTGDVLAGIISGIYSQNKNAVESAIAGAYIHGKCGDNLYKSKASGSMTAGDLIPEISNLNWN